jgi:hypothetical protein
MEQDVISTSWKDLPWQKFQKKSFRLQCEIYKAKQNNKPRLVRRLQKLLIKSKSVHYLAVRRISEVFRNKGLFLSGDKKFSLVEESYYGIGNWRHTSFKSFSKGKNSREFFNMSFLRNKVIEYIWKFTIEPTCLNKGIDFNRKIITNSNKKIVQKFANLQTFKDQMILKVVVDNPLNKIDSNILMSRLSLPSHYKLGIYRAIKKHALELNVGKGTLASIFPSILLDGFENLTTLPIQEDRSTNYLHKVGFCHGNEILYFLRKDQNEAYLVTMIRDFLESRGLGINSTHISIHELSSGFIFSKMYVRSKMDTHMVIVPSLTCWSNHKKNIIYTLKKEKITSYSKIQKLKCMFLTWVHYNHDCSRAKIKSSFFYIKKLLAKYT